MNRAALIFIHRSVMASFTNSFFVGPEGAFYLLLQDHYRATCVYIRWYVALSSLLEREKKRAGVFYNLLLRSHYCQCIKKNVGMELY